MHRRAPRSSDLDAEEAFNKHAVEEIASLSELRKAPLVDEEYHGPLLLSADAGADTMRSLLAGAVTATRPKLGTEARTNGPFASSYQARVLPEFHGCGGRSGTEELRRQGSGGRLRVDDEGVPAQAVKLVRRGSWRIISSAASR